MGEGGRALALAEAPGGNGTSTTGAADRRPAGLGAGATGASTGQAGVGAECEAAQRLRWAMGEMHIAHEQVGQPTNPQPTNQPPQNH
jgi:hypothetical protein